MRKQLLDLEKTSRLLEPTADEREAVRSKVVRYTEDFLEHIETLPAYQTSKEMGIGLLDSPITENGMTIDKLISLLKENVDTPGLNPASGGHLGYIPGGGIYVSALGDYLADVMNRFAGVFYAGPGAVRMENMLISWMNKMVGYPKTASGNLTTGGSLANLISIVTARDAMNISATNIQRSVIYLSQQSHHSVAKAIRIAGLKECIIRYIELDKRFRIYAPALEKQIEQDKKDKLNPFLVIASAGTTDVGAIDPLLPIGDICKKHKLWYHIDAAYGGFFMMTKEGKEKLRGIEKSDSLVIDPHKGLFLPYGLGVALIKKKKHLQDSHSYFANYMQDTVNANDETSPGDLSPELTKHFRGLRLWLPLKLHGVKPFRACLEEKLLLAKYFYREIKKLGFESAFAPELSVVTYRYIPKKGDPDSFNKKLIAEVVKDGRIFISSTMLDGKFTLRFACLAFRTHLNTVDTLLDVLKEKVKMLEV